MKFSKIYTFIFLAFFSFQSTGQSVDQSILSQLTPEQIEMAKDIYKSDNTLVLGNDNPPVVVESLVGNIKSDDININPGKKYGYEFFLQCQRHLLLLVIFLFQMIIRFHLEINLQSFYLDQKMQFLILM